MDTDRPQLCQHKPCGKPIQAAKTGRPPKYCSGQCRKRAWEAERLRRAVVVELAKLAAKRQRTFRPDETPRPDPRPQVPSGRNSAAGGGWVRSKEEIEAQLRELERRRSAPAPARPRRRPLLPPPPDPT